jgi:NhaP-type Na+/H+ or K+/H+ antiporter
LFYLVFGESVLNDAVGLTIFNIAAKFVGIEYSDSVSAAHYKRYYIEIDV